MEPSQNIPAADGLDPAPSPWGELVVQNGRQSGVRRALSDPITLIGRAPGCDLRLNAKGVHLMHCALVQSPAGLVLRNLDNQAVTLVNGEPATNCFLQEGDLLTVGPFHFRIRLPQAQPSQEADLFSREKEALRIQAAAVAAQQAALLEEENRLQQKRVALQKQEEQLAAHLEERRQHLSELREQVHVARAALRQERTEHAEYHAEVQREIERDQHRNQATQYRLQLKRQRLIKLHRGLKRRFHRTWDTQEALMCRRETAANQQQRELEKERERLQKNRAAFLEMRQRFHGEIELGKRQLIDAQQQLAAERRDWEAHRARQYEELGDRTEVLEERTANVGQAEQELSRQQRRWQDLRFNLEQETEGLESRIRNQRRLLFDQQSELARLSALTSHRGPEAPALTFSGPPGPTLPVPVASIDKIPAVPAAVMGTITVDYEHRLRAVEKLAVELADQRLHLAEQFERLIRAQQNLQREREQVADEVEAVVVRLQERERHLDGREHGLAPMENALEHRREELAQVRCHLEAWRSRLSARETSWEAERETLLADITSREKLLQEQQTILADLRQRWLGRRQQEMEQLRTEQTRSREAFRHFTSLWGEYFRRNGLLEQEQRVLAEKALALEQYRLECIGHAENSAMADRRLERLRRRWVTLSAVAERRLARDREALEAQLTFLEDRFGDLEEQASHQSRQKFDRFNQQSEADQQNAAAREGFARLNQALQSMRAQRDVYQWQLGRLRDDMERMALTMIEESDSSSPPEAQAA